MLWGREERLTFYASFFLTIYISAASPFPGLKNETEVTEKKSPIPPKHQIIYILCIHQEKQMFDGLNGCFV